MANRHFMNPSLGKHMEQEEDGRSEDQSGKEKKSDDSSSDAKHPSIHVHSHDKGHTVHVYHSDGRHEKHEHERGDAEGIAAHIHSHLGGKHGQDHGFSSGSLMEDEDSSGGPGV